jgi:hypothetical protein
MMVLGDVSRPTFPNCERGSFMDRMDKSTIRKVKTSEQGTDFAYWQSRTPQERLQALEAIRREYHRGQFGNEPRFQRVLRIVNQK